MTQEAKNTRSMFIGLIVIGVLLVGIVSVMNLRQALNAPRPTETPPEGVIPVEPPIIPQDFTLPGSSGQPLRLSDLRGKWTLMAFGYTHCPDICPLTLADWKQVKTGLGEKAAQVNFLFISVDGERDTPAILQRYLSRFDPAFAGMSGVGNYAEQLRADFGLDYTLHTEEGENYTVDHTTRNYLLDPEGRMIYQFPFERDENGTPTGVNKAAIISTISRVIEAGA
jgi:protein SCO1/2